MMSKPSEAERSRAKMYERMKKVRNGLEEKVGKVRNGQHSYKGGKRKQKQKST